jgi:lambda family phage portal protein
VGVWSRILGRSGAKASASSGATALVGSGWGYEASRLNRRLRGWTAERSNINALLTRGGDLLRARARQLCRENPYAANAVEAFVAAAVGTGIKPSSLITDAAMRAQIQAVWLAWTDEADADGLTDFYGLQALVARAMFEGGECFVRFRPRRPEDGLLVPLQLQLLEAELLPLTHNEDLGGGRRIRAGIEFDAIGRRTAYHFLREHPGDALLGASSVDKTVVPASEVMHVYRPLRPGQIRGQPEITPGMIRLYLLDQYDDAELDRKRVAAMFAGFVTSPAPDPERPLGGEEAVSGDTAILPLEPGMIQVLAEGQDITFSSPSEVGGSYEAFQFRALNAIAAALGLPYHSVTGDVSKANYSSLRASQVEFRRRMDQFQHATLVYQLCRPVWQRWLETAVFAGVITGLGPVRYNRERRELTAAKWIPPKWDWVDPLKDRQAQALAEDRGWTARSDSIEAEGFDPEEVDARILADRQREAEKGLKFPREATTPAAQREAEITGS